MVKTASNLNENELLITKQLAFYFRKPQFLSIYSKKILLKAVIEKPRLISLAIDYNKKYVDELNEQLLKQVVK